MRSELLLNSYFFNRRVFIVCEELCIAAFAHSQRWKTDTLYDLKIAIHGNSRLLSPLFEELLLGTEPVLFVLAGFTDHGFAIEGYHFSENTLQAPLICFQGW